MKETPYDKYPSSVLFSWAWARKIDPLILDKTTTTNSGGVDIAKFGTPNTGMKLPII